MELQDLKNKWAEYDSKLDASIRLNAQLLRESVLSRANTVLTRLSRSILAELIVNFAAVVLLGAFIADHVGHPRFVVPAALLDVFAIALVIAGIRQLVALRTLDYGAPVVEIQRRLEWLKIRRIQATKWALLLAPLLWTPLLIVALKGLFRVDAYAVFAQPWLAANVVFSAAVVVLVVWASRRHAERWKSSPLVRRLMDDIAGRNLNAATNFLGALSRFEIE
jgi:hypothetical protein